MIRIVKHFAAYVVLRQLFFLTLFFLPGFFLLRSEAAIQDFSVTDYSPGPVSTGSSHKLGSNVVLNLAFVADAGVYTVNAYRNSDMSQIVAKKDNISHPGGAGDDFLRVPLVEGDNEFFLRLIETSMAGGEKTTNTAAMPLVRDLEFEVSQVRLNHIEAEGEDAGQIIGLYTRQPKVSIFYTINGNAEKYQVSILRNSTVLQSFEKDKAGSASVTGIELETSTLNLFQLQVAALDINGVSLGVQAESNMLRIFHNTNPPQILSVEASFQAAPPAVGVPWGPTDLANIGIRVDVRGTDLHGAEILITDISSGSNNEYRRRIHNDGRHTIAGIELPRDPAVGMAGSTITTYSVRLTDAAGNFSVGEITVERIGLEPCFNLLFMRPEDGATLKTNEAISVTGAVCDENKPHKVVFYIASLFSDFSYYREEQIKNLYGGQFFIKDISLPTYGPSPNDNMAYSIQAEVIVTHPFDPNREEVSPRHDLGTVIFDRKPPPAPNIFTEKMLLATNSPSFTVDGDIERWSNLEIIAPGSFVIRPARVIAATGNEFRAVIDLGNVNDGEYMLDLSARDKAGNTGPGSISHLVVKYDRSLPQVKVLRVNDSPLEPSNPLFVKPGQIMRLQVLLDKKMQVPPRVWVTEQGANVAEAGMNKVITEGYEYEYQYVIKESQDGEHDGWVEVLVTGGRDVAGNVLSPSLREPRAFVIDTLPPVLQRKNILPPDGSVVNAAPAPIRFVMTEHPDTKDIGSGPNPLACKVSCFGPLEETPDREISGRLEVFDPRTIDFYPLAAEMDRDGTYLFRIDMVDKVGNNFVETVVIELDLQALSTHLIVQEFPVPDSYSNAETLPRTNGLPYISISVEPALTKEIALDKTKAVVSNFLRAPQNFPLSAPELLSSTAVRFKFLKDVKTDGSDDGVLTAHVHIEDKAGNISEEKVFSWYYDTLAPKVMDGWNFPVPSGYKVEDLRFPLGGSAVSGPLNVLSAVVFDVKSPTGFLGTGLKTDIESSAPFTTTTINLVLEQSFGSVLPGTVVSGRIKFRGDLSGSAPVFGGPLVSRVLYELNVDPVSLEPLGLATDGSIDGIFRMDIIPFDMSLNQGEISSSYFLYDTQVPEVSVDVDNEVWISSSVIELSGWAKDQGERPSSHPKFGSLYGMGVQTVEIRVEAVNEYGSATIPAMIDWKILTLDKNPALYPSGESFNFEFSDRFRNYQGPVRITVRAFDRAGNEGRFIRDLSLDTENLPDPVLISPLAEDFCAGGIVTFRWQPVEKANRYLLELTDAQLNKYTYEYDKGIVEAVVNLNMLPEGRTVWRILAVDGVGRNSPGTNGRFLTVDRGLPGVESFVFNKPLASPDNEGRILETLLRFHVNFTEKLDEKIVPVVEFLPSPKEFVNSLGQKIVETYPPIMLETIDFKDNSYTGTFRVKPTVDNYDYNGMAAIRVRDYFDAAGNPGLAWTEHFEVDLGPYFDFRVFSNPIQEKELIFVVKSLHHKGGKEEELVSVPLMKIRQLKNPSQISDEDPVQLVGLSRMGGAYFHGGYVLNLNYSGSLRIEITGEDKHGNSITRILPFQVNRLSFSRQSVGLPEVTELTEMPELTEMTEQTVDAGRVENRCFFPWFTHNRIEKGSIPLWNVFPAGDMEKEITQNFDLTDYRVLPNEKYAVVKKLENAWEYVPQLRQENRISLKSRHLSSLYLIEDAKSPALEIAHSASELQELAEDLRFRLYDEGVGLNPASLSLTINGRLVKSAQDGNGEYVVQRSLMRSGESNNVQIEAADYLDNKIKKSLSVVPVGVIRINQALIVPNPVRDRGNLVLRMNRKADYVNFTLYDAASRRIRRLEQSAVEKSASLPLDGILQAGMANGVYFLRLNVHDSEGGQDTKIIKFVILR